MAESKDISTSAWESAAVLFWPEERWRELQARRLATHVAYARKSSLYRALADQAGQGRDVEDILQRLPMTTKDDLAAAGPAAWGIGSEEVREWVCTSGTLGQALDVPLSARDLDRLAENEAVALGLAGVQRGDVLLLGVGMDRLFVAGLAYWLGAQKLGAACVRVGPQIASVGGEGLLVDVCRRFGREGSRIYLIAVPSFLAAAAPEMGQGKTPGILASARLAGIIGIGEALRNADLAYNLSGRRLGERFGCPILSTYASTETCTTFAEGPQCIGGHLNPRLAAVEIIDEAGRPMPAGTVGEVVVTPLGVEGLPLLRFRTGDMAALYTEPCPCGRTTPRLGPIVGRRQQLLKLRGTSLYPGVILEALRGIEAVADCLIVAERDELGGDRVVVFVEVEGKADPGAGIGPIEAQLGALLRVTPEVRCVNAADLARMRGGSRKIQRFIDRRGDRPRMKDKGDGS